MRGRDVVAGVLLVNTVPHVLVAASRGRCRTPFSPEPVGPAANLLWGVTNLVGGAALLASGDEPGDQAAVDERRRAVHLGCLLMTLAGGVYEVRQAVRRV